MAADLAAAGIGGAFAGGENVLPAPFPVGVGVLALQGKRQIDRAVTFGQVVAMQGFDPNQVRLQGFDQAGRQHRDPIFLAFAGADDDLALGEVHIFNP